MRHFAWRADAARRYERPCTILTKDLKDFPPKPLAKRGARVTDPDTYLCELVEDLPDEVTTTVVRLAAEKSRPAQTPHDLLDDLAHAGAPRFAETTRFLPPTD